MKKTVSLFFLIFGALLFSQESADLNLEKWVMDIKPNSKNIAGYKIGGCKSQDDGVSVMLDKIGIPYELIIMSPVSLSKIEDSIKRFEVNILKASDLKDSKHDLKFEYFEFVFSDQNDVVILGKVESYQLRINFDTLIELNTKIPEEVWFVQDLSDDSHIFSFQIKDIVIDRGDAESFVSWKSFGDAIIEWLKEGLDIGDQKRMAFILETKVLSDREKDKEKGMLLVDTEKSRYILGGALSFSIPKIVFGGIDGVYGGPSYMSQDMMLYLRIKDLGPEKFDNKPIDFYCYLGGFLEINYGYPITMALIDNLEDFETTSLITGGIRTGAGVSFYVPRVIDGVYKDRLFGIGLEMFFDIPFNYSYEYDFNVLTNFLIHLLPNKKIKLDTFYGVNIAFKFQSSANLDLFGLQVGVRVKFDWYNFNKYKKVTY